MSGRPSGPPLAFTAALLVVQRHKDRAFHCRVHGTHAPRCALVPGGTDGLIRSSLSEYRSVPGRQ